MDGLNNLEPQELYQKILDGKIRRFPPNYWKQSGVEEVTAIITRYFIEQILNWDEKDIKEKTNEMVFRKHKLSGMLEYVFDRSPFQAIEEILERGVKSFLNLHDLKETLNWNLNGDSSKFQFKWGQSGKYDSEGRAYIFD